MERSPLPRATSLGGSGFQQAMGGRSEIGRQDSAGSFRAAGSSDSQTPRSYVPASLGIANSIPPSKSLRERLKLTRNVSASSLINRSQSSDGLHFPDAEPVGRNGGEFSSFSSIPSWGSQSQTSSSRSYNGLSTSSSMGSFSSAAMQSNSRNFLVPIGATGARQKLSIANASQRRRLAISEDTSSAQDTVQRSGPGLHRSQSDFYNLSGPSGSASQPIGRSTSTSVFPTPSISTSSSISASRSAATPAELVQQAAMQRLTSQRIMPPYGNRSVSDSMATPTSSSTRTSRPPSTPGSPILDQSPSRNTTHPIPESERRPDPAPNNTSTIPGRTANIIVPDRTASSLQPTSRQVSHAAAQGVNGTFRQPDSTRPFDSDDGENDRSISSKPLTLAETYKRAMQERDAARAQSTARAATSLQEAILSAPGISAPSLDLNLPSSTLCFDDDGSSASSPVPIRQAQADSTRPGLTFDPRKNGRNGNSSPASNGLSKVKSDNEKRVAAVASPSSPQASTDLPSLQKSYDEAMAIQDRILSGVTDEPAYGGLFDGYAAPLSRRKKDKDSARSYLALRDDEDEIADRQVKPLAKQEAVATIVSRQQDQRSAAGTLSNSQDPAPVTPRTPPENKSLTQSSAPEDETSRLRTALETFEFTPSRNVRQPDNRPAPQSLAVEIDRPSLPRDPSLQTLRSPPNKLEQQPDPREEAALRAGASAATTTSPIPSTRQANATKMPIPASPIIDGERTVQSSDHASDGMKWRRSQDALAALSPAQQSRFSEASTDLSDSRAPTRNEHRYSGRASSVSSADGLDEESTDGHVLPTSAWHEVENALKRFRDRSTSVPAERGNLLRAVLLPFLALEAETATIDPVGPGPYFKGKARRALFFDWIRSLLLELQHVQTSADRGAILESIACIIESRNFSAPILSTDPEDEARFSSVFGHILSYAIGELNKKGVYQNTLIFSGRLLAVAFFRVNGVASKLLRALPVNRFALERVAREFDWQRKRPVDFDKFANRFPATLRQLCYRDSREYLKMLDSESIAGAANESGSQSAEDDRFLVCQPEVEVEMSGNWLRRWQSDDSELFFSFCRSYHRQLASLFASSRSLDNVSKHFFGGPGYAHLATCVHQKCLALVHRVILSVTTLSSQKNFNPAGETANVLSGSTAGKPRILEAANRRCTAIVVDIVRAPAGSNMIFAPMLGLHIKALIKRTSLYDVQGVFCLLDWLDGVLSHMDSNDLINEGLVDISFIITTIGMLLENADHALALMRTIAFCYANFGVLTATTENRAYFCEQILLKPTVFHKLFLSWSFTIRAYYLHLLVFRLARIRDFPSPPDDPTGRTAIRVVRLFNQRLEALRKRHDSLSPEIDSSSDDTRSEDSKSRKSGTSTFVSTIKRSSTDGTSTEGSVEGRPKAEKIMGMTAVEPIATPKAKAAESKKVSHSKTKSWLKAFRGGAKDGKPESGRGSNSPRAVGTRSPTTGRVMSAESDDDSKTIGSTRTTPRGSFESNSSDAMSDVSTLAGSVHGVRSSKSSGAFEFDIKQQAASQQHTQSSRSTSDGSSGTSTTAANSVLSPMHDAGIAKDTVFDLQSMHAQHLPTPGKTPQSPRISKAFARRASMLPGPASELVARGEEDEIPPVPELPADSFGLGLSGMNVSSAEVYDETLHIYAVQSLREYEQTVQEHDDFFASLPEDQSAQVPRLPVNWPAMWSSTGE